MRADSRSGIRWEVGKAGQGGGAVSSRQGRAPPPLLLHSSGITRKSDCHSRVKGKTTRGFVAHWPLITIHRLYQRPLSAYTAPVQRDLYMDRIADDTRIN